MRKLIVAFAAVAALAASACSADNKANEPHDNQSLGVHLNQRTDPQRLAHSLGFPAQQLFLLRDVPGDNRIGPPGTMRWMRIISWREYRRLDTAKFRPGTAGELLEFTLQHQKVMNEHIGVCAPGTKLKEGYLVISRGTSLGVWKNSCKWALVVEKA